MADTGGIVTICGTTMTGYTWISYMRNTGKRLNLMGLHAKSARKLAGTTKKQENQKITESDAPRGSQHQQAPEL